MLRRLSIENYALIDRLEMELNPHLNIITGETGAGKSILLGALGLLLGNKNDGTATKEATKNCVIEAVFDIKELGLEPFFDDNDLDFLPDTTITRMITPSGKSRAFINDVPVQLALLKELGAHLIDIHSQHQNLIISSEKFRISALDTVASNGSLLAKYGSKYGEYVDLKRQLSRLRSDVESSRKDEDWLTFQVEELTSANLKSGEDGVLEREFAVLENADQINEALALVHNALDNDDVGILLQLKSSENALRRINESYPQATELIERIYSTIEELKDINSTIFTDSESIESDPERLNRVSSKLDTIYSLCRKHKVETLDELIEVRDRYTEQLAAITHGDERLSLLEGQISRVKDEAIALAKNIHQSREKSCVLFEKAILATLSKLGMVDTIFKISLLKLDELCESGHDSVDFLFSANRDMKPQPVERVASGGEMSRVMLAIKALLAQNMNMPTIIFDEIDAGVSGRIAEAMGDIILSLSTSMQVVDITHLPQVASKGDTHFVVSKTGGKTSISCLSEEERTIEIAKMLSGSVITDAALAQARILLTDTVSNETRKT